MLNVNQFQRFISVLKKLGERVEREHTQHLRDSQRIEDGSTANTNGTLSNTEMGAGLDFESLVGRSSNIIKPDIMDGSGLQDDDDVWGSILGATSQVSYYPKYHTHAIAHSAAAKSRNSIATDSISTSFAPLSCNPVQRNRIFCRRAIRVHLDTEPRAFAQTSVPFHRYASGQCTASATISTRYEYECMASAEAKLQHISTGYASHDKHTDFATDFSVATFLRFFQCTAGATTMEPNEEK